MPSVSPFLNKYSAVDLHQIYGVNCYQHAIGYHPITVYFNKRTSSISYSTLCPGDLTNIISQNGKSSLKDMAAYEAKKQIILACKQDTLEELEARSPDEAISIPPNKKLIAFFFSGDCGDFDFHVLNNVTNMWENKTPFAEVSISRDLPRRIPGGYVLTRLFIAADNIQPNGVTIGRRYNYPNGLTLNLPSHIPHNERGPCLIKTRSGEYELVGRGAHYPAPDLSFLND